MIRSQEMMAEIQAVSEQNAMLMQQVIELRQLVEQTKQQQGQHGGGQSSSDSSSASLQEKDMGTQGQNSGAGSGQGKQLNGGQQEQGQQQNQGQQGQQQDQGQNQNGGQQAQNRNGGQQGQSGQAQGQITQNPQISSLAGDLLKLKTMVQTLEIKTSQFVSSQTNGSLTDKDVVNLVLLLMDGMLSWASDFIASSQSGSGSGQLQ